MRVRITIYLQSQKKLLLVFPIHLKTKKSKLRPYFVFLLHLLTPLSLPWLDLLFSCLFPLFAQHTIIHLSNFSFFNQPSLFFNNLFTIWFQLFPHYIISHLFSQFNFPSPIPSSLSILLNFEISATLKFIALEQLK